MVLLEVYCVLVSVLVLLKDVHANPSCSLDVAFLMDSSGSMGEPNYVKEKQFVKQTASLLDIPNASRAAVIVFSTNSEIAINFTDSRTLSDFQSSVDRIRYFQSTTRIDKALILAAKDVFPQARAQAIKIALVLTDGKQSSNALPLLNASQPLRDIDVRVIAVGIGYNVDERELREMVLFPRDVFLVTSFSALVSRVQEISQYMCNISRPTTVYPSSTLNKPTSSHFSCKTSQNSSAITFIKSINSLDHQDVLSLKNATSILASLINQLKTQRHSFTGSDVMCCVRTLEEFGFRFAEYFLQTSSSNNITLDTECVAFHAQKVKANTSEDYIFPSSNITQHGVRAVLPREIFRDKDVIVVGILYKKLHVYLKEMSFNLTKQQLGTKIMSITIKPRTNYLRKNVTLRFKPITTLQTEPLCVFWKYAQLLNKESGWSTAGCSLMRSDTEITECTCNHLTHFAVLMQIDDDEISPSDQTALSVITYIGIGVSLAGCLLTLILHFAFVNVRAQLSQIHVNLVISIAIGQIIFIAGINATENKIACVCVAALIQYFYLVAFCWMLVEGIQLYLRIVKVFNFEHGMPANYIFAWGFPLVVVSATIGASANSKGGIVGFVHDKFCWLSFKNKLAWTFVGPVLAITLINVILLLHVIREMARMDKAMVGLTPQLDIVRKTAKACAVLFPLLGITWLFGILTMTEVGVAAQYIFTILNSIQGFLIFILNCVRNSEIRSKVKAKLHMFHRPKTPSTVVPDPSPFTHSLQPQQTKKFIKTAFTNRQRDSLPAIETPVKKWKNNKGI